MQNPIGELNAIGEQNAIGEEGQKDQPTGSVCGNLSMEVSRRLVIVVTVPIVRQSNIMSNRLSGY